MLLICSAVTQISFCTVNGLAIRHDQMISIITAHSSLLPLQRWAHALPCPFTACDRMWMIAQTPSIYGFKLAMRWVRRRSVRTNAKKTIVLISSDCGRNNMFLNKASPPLGGQGDMSILKNKHESFSRELNTACNNTGVSTCNNLHVSVQVAHAPSIFTPFFTVGTTREFTSDFTWFVTTFK